MEENLNLISEEELNNITGGCDKDPNYDKGAQVHIKGIGDRWANCTIRYKCIYSEKGRGNYKLDVVEDHNFGKEYIEINEWHYSQFQSGWYTKN